MKKIITIMCCVFSICFFSLIPNNSVTGQAEKTNNEEIVGTWATSFEGNTVAYQFKSDGSGIYYLSHSMWSDEALLLKFNYIYDGIESLSIKTEDGDDIQLFCSICGNGMLTWIAPNVKDDDIVLFERS